MPKTTKDAEGFAVFEKLNSSVFDNIHHVLWKKLVPKNGACDSVQGELVRALGCLVHEGFANGNLNWTDQKFDFNCAKYPSGYIPEDQDEDYIPDSLVKCSATQTDLDTATYFDELLNFMKSWFAEHPLPEWNIRRQKKIQALLEKGRPAIPVGVISEAHWTKYCKEHKCKMHIGFSDEDEAFIQAQIAYWIYRNPILVNKNGKSLKKSVGSVFEDVLKKQSKKGIPHLSSWLDGRQFDSIADQIKALRVTGVYIQPRSDQGCSHIIRSAQLVPNAKASFEENTIHSIKRLIGKQLLKEANVLAKLRSHSKAEYVQDLKQQTADFVGDGELQFIDDDEPRYGLTWKQDWLTPIQIDPILLELFFEKVYRNHFTSDEVGKFTEAFESYRSDESNEFLDKGTRLSDRDDRHAMTNFDFYDKHFDTRSKLGLRTAKKFDDLIRNGVCSPFSEYCAFTLSSDDCFFSLWKGKFYTVIAGQRDGGILDICIFDGAN